MKLKENVLVILLTFASISACRSTKQYKLFKDLPDQGSVKLGAGVFTEPKIGKDDLLTIFVNTLDPSATIPINSANGTPVSFSGANLQAAPVGFLVDQSGNVEVPILGKIKVEGLTTSEAKDTIRKRAATFFQNPTVTLRLANFKVTLLGEVAKPATYTFTHEKVSILEALGDAGDVTVFGKRENVLIIRSKNDGTREAYRLDLTDSRAVRSPYFYLRPQDVVVVEARKIKLRSANSDRGILVSFITTAITILAFYIQRY